MIVVPTDPRWHLAFDAAAWAAGAGLGAILHRWRLREAAIAIAVRTDALYGAALAAGAILGAFAAGAAAGAPLSHSVAGALAGAIVAVELYKRVRGIEGSTGILFAAPFALGIAVGRWGCLLAGLKDGTYGVPTGLPWAVDLGDGVPRHPVQLYESAAMAIFTACLVAGMWRRRAWAMRRGFYTMTAFYGAQRFVWEFLKPYPRLIGPFNIFHVICVGLVIYGLGMARRDRGRERGRERAQGGAVRVLGPDDEPV